MNSFEERERAFEAKFIHDAELEFTTHARCVKMMGQWAAEQLGLKDDIAAGYVMDLVMVDLQKSDSKGLINKLRADFNAKGIDVSDVRITEKLMECYNQAKIALS